MPMPMEYWNASKDFEKLLIEVRDTCMLQTHHQAYQTLRAVLHVFRSHLAVSDALKFAGILPPVARAIFVEDWDGDAAPIPFPGNRQILLEEVMAVRADHNLSPESAIGDVTAVVRRFINKASLERELKRLGGEAAKFWMAT
jgi:uncharacterized protein (DUF2267 family)